MKHFTKIFSFSLFVTLLSACCTKKYCPEFQFQSDFVLNAVYQGYTYLPTGEHELDNATLYHYTHNDNSLLYSKDIRNYKDTFNILFHYTYGLSMETIRKTQDSYFVLSTLSTQDTIHISFELEESKMKCNTCFLASDIRTIYTPKNFKAKYHNQNYALGNLIVIQK